MLQDLARDYVEMGNLYADEFDLPWEYDATLYLDQLPPMATCPTFYVLVEEAGTWEEGTTVSDSTQQQKPRHHRP